MEQTILKSTVYPIDDQQFMIIYNLLEPIIKRLIEYYYHQATSSGVIIPRADLKSTFWENLWESILVCQKEPKLSLKKVFLHRVKLRDSDLYRQNQIFVSCSSLDTDNQETDNATSLIDKIATRLTLMDEIVLKKALLDFSKVYPEEGHLLNLLIAG